MSAKSYTKMHFGGNIRIIPLLQNKIYFYLLGKRVLGSLLKVRDRCRAWGDVENPLRQTLDEIVTL